MPMFSSANFMFKCTEGVLTPCIVVDNNEDFVRNSYISCSVIRS